MSEINLGQIEEKAREAYQPLNLNETHGTVPVKGDVLLRLCAVVRAAKEWVDCSAHEELLSYKLKDKLLARKLEDKLFEALKGVTL